MKPSSPCTIPPTGHYNGMRYLTAFVRCFKETLAAYPWQLEGVKGGLLEGVCRDLSRAPSLMSGSELIAPGSPDCKMRGEG